MASNKKALSAIEVGTGDEDSLSYSQDGEQSMYAQPQPMPHIRPYYSGAYQNRPLLYTMHFFFAFVSRMWDFGIVLLVAELTDNSLTLVAMTGLCSSLAIFLFMPTVGHWLDRRNRMVTVHLSIAVKFVAVTLGYAACAYLSSARSKHGEDTLYITLLYSLPFIGALAGMSFSTVTQSVEKDWIVVLSNGDSDWLATTNSAMTQIDLACSSLAPAATGVLFARLSHGVVALVLLAVNAGAAVALYSFMTHVYMSWPALGAKPGVDVPDGVELSIARLEGGDGVDGGGSSYQSDGIIVDSTHCPTAGDGSSKSKGLRNLARETGRNGKAPPAAISRDALAAELARSIDYDLPDEGFDDGEKNEKGTAEGTAEGGVPGSLGGYGIADRKSRRASYSRHSTGAAGKAQAGGADKTHLALYTSSSDMAANIDHYLDAEADGAASAAERKEWELVGAPREGTGAGRACGAGESSPGEYRQGQGTGQGEGQGRIQLALRRAGAFLHSGCAGVMISYAALYFTVLSFGSLMTVYVRWAGVPDDQLGMYRGVGAMMGYLGATIFPVCSRSLGLWSSAQLAIMSQFFLVALAASSFWWAPTALTVRVVIAAVLLSRTGLWLFDLCVRQIAQETIPEAVRGLVNGQWRALVALFDMCSYLLALAFPDPREFWVLSLVSAAMVGFAMMVYTYSNPLAAQTRLCFCSTACGQHGGQHGTDFERTAYRGGAGADERMPLKLGQLQQEAQRQGSRHGERASIQGVELAELSKHFARDIKQSASP